MQDTGYLLVSARTADGVLLLPGADVRVIDSEGQTVYQGKTDRDGYTEEISVATPPRANSMTPDGGRPFAEVGISVGREGFYTASYSRVPIFPGVVTIQPTSLQAVPQSGGNFNASFDEGSGNRL